MPADKRTKRGVWAGEKREAYGRQLNSSIRLRTRMKNKLEKGFIWDIGR